MQSVSGAGIHTFQVALWAGARGQMCLTASSQLAKTNKYIPCMSLPYTWYRVERFGLKHINYTFEKYDICEYVEFGVISWKKYILSNCSIKVLI